MKFLPAGYNTDDQERKQTNKWRWQWLNEVDSEGDKWGLWLRKPDIAGVAFCEFCSKTIKYGSSGKKAIRSHADKDEKHKSAKKTVRTNQVCNLFSFSSFILSIRFFLNSKTL